jgi:hypothetical protein
MTDSLNYRIETAMLAAQQGRRFVAPTEYIEHITALRKDADDATTRAKEHAKGALDVLDKLNKMTADRDAALNRLAQLEAENADLRARAAGCALNAADLAGALTKAVNEHADRLAELMDRVARLEDGTPHADDRGEPTPEVAKGCEGCRHDRGDTCYALPSRGVAEWIDDATPQTGGRYVPSPGQGTCPGRVEASRG